MLPVSELPPLALVIPAVACLACTAIGRPWPRHPGRWARWVMRFGLLLALACVVALLSSLRPAGVLDLTLWRLGPTLPITLQVEVGGATMGVLVLAAALVVSFAAREARPLASAALGLAALGGMLVAFAGDLMALFIGLQLSALGGITLSYARHPRAPSRRVLAAALVDQALALVWLGAVMVVLRGSGTLRLSAVPPSEITPLIAGLLILPGVVRLGSCGLLSGRAGSGHLGRARLLDVADWYTVVALPTGLMLLLRIQELAGGAWPETWFGTSLDLLGLVLGVVAVGWVLYSGDPAPELRALPLACLALVLAGFGQNSATGTLLALAGALFLELAVAFLPRTAHGFQLSPKAPYAMRSLARLQAGVGRLALLLPFSLVVGVGVLGMGLALGAGVESGLAPAAAYLAGLAALALLIPRAWAQAGRWAGSPALLVPALGLLASALVPGWAVMVGAAALPAVGSGASALSAPDPLSLAGMGTIWPGGYLALLALILAVAVAGLRLAADRPLPTLFRTAPRGSPANPPPWVRELVRWRPPARLLPETASWSRQLLGLADRELAERPVWLWVGAAGFAAWAVTELIRL